MNKVHFTTLTLGSLQQWTHATSCVKKNLCFSEVIAEAFTRNHLVISMHQPVGLEVRGIDDELCLLSRRQIV